MPRYRPSFACISILALSGCTSADWDHAMTYTGLAEEPSVAAAPVPAPAPRPVAAAAAPDTGFCQAVAKQDAGQDGFDAATQQRVFQRSFQQCVALFGTEAPSRGSLAAN